MTEKEEVGSTWGFFNTIKFGNVRYMIFINADCQSVS